MCVCLTESAGCAVRPRASSPSLFLLPVCLCLCIAAHNYGLSVRPAFVSALQHTLIGSLSGLPLSLRCSTHSVNSMAAARGCVLMWVSTDVGAPHAAAAAWHWPYCTLEGMRSCRQARLKCIQALARYDTATRAQVRGMCWDDMHLSAAGLLNLCLCWVAAASGAWRRSAACLLNLGRYTRVQPDCVATIRVRLCCLARQPTRAACALCGRHMPWTHLVWFLMCCLPLVREGQQQQQELALLRSQNRVVPAASIQWVPCNSNPVEGAQHLLSPNY